MCQLSSAPNRSHSGCSPMRLFASHQPIAAAYVDLWTTTSGGAFTCYGSVLDNATSDPTTVLPQ